MRRGGRGTEHEQQDTGEVHSSLPACRVHDRGEGVGGAASSQLGIRPTLGPTRVRTGPLGRDGRGLAAMNVSIHLSSAPCLQLHEAWSP